MIKSTRPTLKPSCVQRPASEAGRTPPADGIAYKVQDGDSWISLARQWAMDPWSLIRYNFRTEDPREVNWYLQEYVGCVRPTKDRKNWCFSSSAVPGIIYRPGKPAPVPGPITRPPWEERPPLPMDDDENSSPSTGAWLGIGVKGGGHIVLGGADTATAFVFSVDDPRRWMILQISMGRVGPGLGASGSVVVVGIGNCYTPEVLQNASLSGADFQLAVGPKWGAMLKHIGKFDAIVSLVRAGGDARHLINAGVINLAKRQELINGLKNNFGMLGLFNGDGETGVGVNVVDTPLGAGTELSAYYAWGGVTVLHIHEPAD